MLATKRWRSGLLFCERPSATIPKNRPTFERSGALDMRLQDQLCTKLAEDHGVSASISGLSDMLRKSGYTYKKITLGKRSHARQAPGPA